MANARKGDKPGRNDPCWCGSGRKYKKCHMAADREKEREKRELKLAARYVRRDLLEFAQDEQFAVPFATALSLYWNGFYTVENADEMSENEALRFFDWFAFDYQLQGGSARVADVYREERWEELSQQQRQILDSWLEAPPAGAYRLVGYEGQMLHLRDLLTGEEYEVYEPGGRGELEVGDVVLARLLPVQDHLEFGAGAAYLPEDEIADLPEKLAEARAQDAELYPDASDRGFLRRHNQLLIHHALEQAERKGRPPVARMRDEE